MVKNESENKEIKRMPITSDNCVDFKQTNPNSTSHETSRQAQQKA
jgi:hypothetical protein